MIKINGKCYSEGLISSASGDVWFERIIVHSGKFHADDVFCAAMFLLCCPDGEVLRVNQVPNEYINDKRSIIADIGFGRYDHHQQDAERREDGSKYAACGLLYRDLKKLLFKECAASESFERKYIIPVEEEDNGGENNPLSEAISAFNPAWNSAKSSDEGFAEAVTFVQGLILREMIQSRAEEEAEGAVRTVLDDSDGRVVVLPKFMPWRKQLIQSSAVYVIYPSARGGYNLQAIPESVEDRKAKKSLPEKWIESKPDGCSFVHPGLFLACFETETAAKDAASEALVS